LKLLAEGVSLLRASLKTTSAARRESSRLWMGA
jgi:hypothetical protein